MFGRKQIVFLQTPQNHYHSSPVHVEQKPHDPADAARLYGELEKRAEERVLSAATVDLPSISAKVALFEISRMMLDDAHHFVIKFEVNGRKMDASLRVERGQLNQDRLVEDVLRLVAEEVARQIVLEPEVVVPVMQSSGRHGSLS